MRRSVTILLLLVIVMTLPLASCGDANEPSLPENPPDTPSPPTPTPTPTPTLAPAPDTLPESPSAQHDADQTGEAVSEMRYASMEEAYYSKYVELAKTYGTHSLCDLYDVRENYTGRSYLNGVCIVNLMDFNGDGINDLFVVYANKQRNTITFESSSLRIFDFPTKDTYEFEIWTYKKGLLTLILHESFVSTCKQRPNDKSDFFQKYYWIFINVYENKNGLPVIQLYNDSEEVRKYTNIYSSNGQIVKDTLTFNGNDFQMNGLEIPENIWSENVAGFNKILLCSLLADSSHASAAPLEWYDMDYNNTLLQTKSVVWYLSREETPPIMQRFHIAEGEYIPLYLQETERSNRLYFGPADGSERTYEDHYPALYDMDRNGVPELILYEGSSGAGMHHHFYTITNGKTVDRGEYGRASLLVNDEGGLIAYFARMGCYQIDKITLENTTIKTTLISEDYTGDVIEYPDLEEFGYNNYRGLAYCPPAIPFALYTYSQALPLN